MSDEPRWSFVCFGQSDAVAYDEMYEIAGWVARGEKRLTRRRRMLRKRRRGWA